MQAYSQDLRERVLRAIERGERLAGQGIQIKAAALWHQLDKWGLSFKKKRCTPASKIGPTCNKRVDSGGPGRPALSRIGWSSWMRRPPART